MASVLIIEDEPNIAMVLKTALEEEGHEVKVAADGLLGVKMLDQDPKPGLVILDLNLPYIEGREILEKIHLSPALRQIPVIVTTGSFTDYLDLPEDSYTELFHKPFDLCKVIRSVNALASGGFNLKNRENRSLVV